MKTKQKRTLITVEELQELRDISEAAAEYMRACNAARCPRSALAATHAAQMLFHLLAVAEKTKR